MDKKQRECQHEFDEIACIHCGISGVILARDLLASVAQLEAENKRLRKAMTRNGQLSVVHLLAWADAIKTENGYSGGNLEVYLRELVVALLEGKDGE